MSKITIKKGCHYPSNIFSRINPRRIVLFPNYISFSIVFDGVGQYSPNGLWWRLERNESYYQLFEQINKIGGLSFDLLNNTSARVGFRYNWEKCYFEICAYFHINGVVYCNQEKFVKVDMYDEVECQIVKTKNKITVSYRNDKGKMIVIDSVNVNLKIPVVGYVQLPYFGGKMPAPNLVRYTIKNIKTKK